MLRDAFGTFKVVDQRKCECNCLRAFVRTERGLVRGNGGVHFGSDFPDRLPASDIEENDYHHLGTLRGGRRLLQ